MTQVTATIDAAHPRQAPHAEDELRSTSGSVRTAAVAGSLWVMIGYGAGQAMRLGGNVVLAWLLAPSAFGLMLLVNTVLHGLSMFSDIGIGPSIIQNKRGVTPDYLRTAWTIQIIRGFVLWLGCCALAWPIAAFFARNDQTYAALVYLLPVAGLSATIAGFNSPALFLLNRRLSLGRLARIEMSSQAIGIGTMIVWGLLAPSVWALVAGGLAMTFAKMVLSHVAMPPHERPRLRVQWHGPSAHALLHFGKWIFASTLVTFLAANLDKPVLGTLLSADLLGLYAIGFVFAKVTMHVGQRLSGMIIFPILSRYQDDPQRVVAMCIRARRSVLWVSGAACAAFAIGGPLFFELLYESRYHPAGDIARWLSMYIWVAVLITSMDQIPLALGSSRALFIANFIKALGILPAIGGYFIAQLPGFIAGLTLGWLLAKIVLLFHVPTQRWALTGQSALFTIGWAALILPGIVLVEHMAGIGRWPEIAVTLCIIMAALMAAAAALWRLEGRSMLESHRRKKRPSSGMERT